MQKVEKIREDEKVLIVGGMGFIGQRLTTECLKYTSNVTCLSLRQKPNKELEQENVEFIQADICEKFQLQAVLKGKTFDYVFNLSGYIDHTPYFQGGRKLIESHFIGLMNVIDCLDRKQLKKFVQIGSSDEYGNAPSPINETTIESPISPYSLGKTASSKLIRMLHGTEGFPGVVLRLFLTYGPGQSNQRFLPQIIQGCLKNKTFPTSSGKQLRDFCYIDDVVEGIIMSALEPKAKGHVINIASGQPVSIANVIKTIVDLIGKGQPDFGAIPYRSGENMELYADTRCARELLGWSSKIKLDEGLQKTIEWYKLELNRKKF